jgi:hypothetical protein
VEAENVVAMLVKQLADAEDAMLRAWLATGRHELWLTLKTLVRLRERLEVEV